jgi:hypothetical protein
MFEPRCSFLGASSLLAPSEPNRHSIIWPIEALRRGLLEHVYAEAKTVALANYLR